MPNPEFEADAASPAEDAASSKFGICDTAEAPITFSNKFYPVNLVTFESNID